MKSALKLLVFFGIGCLIGIVLVCAGIVSFTDMTWNELVQKLAKIEALEVVGIFAGSIVCTLVAFILQIVLHEGGHLLFGLLSGYRFVSFRIFNWTLIRQEGKFRLKRFGIAGTGGQCLMLPPRQAFGRDPCCALPLGRRYCQYVGSAFGFCGLVCGGRSFSSAGTIPGYDVFCRCVVGIAQWHPVQAGNY